MALINYEHFDLYGGSAVSLATRGYTYPVTAPFFATSVVRTGTYAVGFSNGTRGQIRWSPPSPLAVIGSGAAMHIFGTPAAGASTQGIRFFPTSGSSIRVLPNELGGVTVWNGTTALGSSAPGLISQNAWFWLEAKVTTGAGSTGAVEVRLNGGSTPIVSLTGLTLTNPIAGVTLGMESTAGQVSAHYDDWIVWDTAGSVNNNFMGDTFVIVAPVNADGTPSDYVPSTGTDRWAMIDDETPDDNDYITANNIGDAQEFTHVAVNLPVGAVAAIATQVRALKTDAGASSIQVGLASGVSAKSMGAEAALGTSAGVVSHISNLDPNGNVPWTQAAAQAARLRLERVA